MLTPFEDDPEPEPGEDEDEFYYNLNRHSAEKQDNPFSGWAALVFFGAVCFIPLVLAAAFFAFGSSLGIVLLLLLLLIVLIPAIFIIAALFGSLTFSSVLASLRELFKPRK